MYNRDPWWKFILLLKLRKWESGYLDFSWSFSWQWSERSFPSHIKSLDLISRGSNSKDNRCVVKFWKQYSPLKLWCHSSCSIYCIIISSIWKEDLSTFSESSTKENLFYLFQFSYTKIGNWRTFKNEIKSWCMKTFLHIKKKMKICSCQR